jgi:adenylosuccinate synthase
MTKADVLDAFTDLNVCTGYNVDGKSTEAVPFQMTRHKIEPLLKSLPGWNTPTDAVKTFGELPETMKEYVKFINSYLGVDISHISNGPGRDQLVEVSN